MQGNVGNGGDQLASRAAVFIVAAFAGAEDRVSQSCTGAKASERRAVASNAGSPWAYPTRPQRFRSKGSVMQTP